MIETDGEDYYLDGMAGSTFSMSVKTMSSTEIRKKYNNKAEATAEEPENNHKQHNDTNPKVKNAKQN